MPIIRERRNDVRKHQVLLRSEGVTERVFLMPPGGHCDGKSAYAPQLWQQFVSLVGEHMFWINVGGIDCLLDFKTKTDFSINEK